MIFSVNSDNVCNEIYYPPRLLLQVVALCTVLAGAVEMEGKGLGEVEAVLDDFPLDDTGGATDRVDEGGGDPESNK